MLQQDQPTYDANGNTIADDRGQTLVYDAWNRLVRVVDAGGGLVKPAKPASSVN